MNCVSRAAIASCLFILSGLTAVAEEDQVFLKRGGVLRGTVSETTPQALTITVGGQRRQVSVAEIRLVSFGDEPAALREARSRAVSGKYARAQQDLQGLKVDELKKPLVRSDLLFYRALVASRVALTTGGDKAAAKQLMLEYVREHRTSHHFLEAAEVLGDLAVAQGDYASAVRFYGSIASKAPSPEYQLRAMLLEARALVDQGQIASAREKYDSAAGVSASSRESQRLKQFAAIGRARCIAEIGNRDEGIRAIQKIVKDNESTDAELFGRAYNALGDCYRIAEQPKDALMAYLHVDVLFYAEPEIHAEALHWIAMLWEQLGKSDRAAAARDLLRSRYAGSRWSKD